MILVEAPVSYPRKKSGSESHSIKLRMSWILWRWHDTPRGGAEREQTTAGGKGEPNIGLQATANSLRSCVATAIGGA